MSAFSKQPFQTVLCTFNRHEPNRNTVHWDGTHYTSTCLGCGKDIRRQAHKVWKEDTEKS
ncbi:hypothetical protein EDF59_101373 [Novosphingobium sp. ST904]|nr:hypothetical protein EDF59_101373 [Novosphingobium sp. ST904]